MGDQVDHVSLTIREELSESMARDVQMIAKPFKIRRKSQKIGRVFHSVRRKNGQHYDPQLISIGPLHRQNADLKPMEALKWVYLEDLMEQSRGENTLENYIDVVSQVITQARSYYSEPIELSDQDFTRLMVLDGCFLIEYLVGSFLGINKTYLGEDLYVPLIKRDMLLLENQFPFLVLQLLFDHSDIPMLSKFENMYGTRITLTQLVVSYVTRHEIQYLPAALEENNIYHVLHIYHASMRPSPFSQVKPAASKYSNLILRMKNMHHWLFHFFFCVMTGHNPWRLQPRDLRDATRAPRSITTVTRLVEFGVKFRYKKSERLTDPLNISFNKETGVMEIPKLSLDTYLVSLFRNIIAFEQSCQRVGNHFTSYAVFMNNLINCDGDVKILANSQIIINKLSDDKEVAGFFNNLCCGSFLDFDNHYLAHVFKDVQEYCEVDHRRWRAELMPYYNHFKRPWAIFSVIVSVFLLVPTILQTFYAVYAYYCPA